MLHVPVISDVFVVHTDASGLVLVGVLNVILNGNTLPIIFFSRQLRDAELPGLPGKVICITIARSFSVHNLKVKVREL